MTQLFVDLQTALALCLIFCKKTYHLFHLKIVWNIKKNWRKSKYPKHPVTVLSHLSEECDRTLVDTMAALVNVALLTHPLANAPISIYSDGFEYDMEAVC